MAITFGYLSAELRSNGNVYTCFTPKAAAEMRPLLCKNIDTAEVDFVRSYGLTPPQAVAFRAEIERDGSARILAAR